jgi:hypothetical protein
LEGKEARKNSGRAATFSVLCRELRLSLTLCSERERGGLSCAAAPLESGGRGCESGVR